METGGSVESGFIISPMSQTISLKAGETYEGEILVAVPKAAKKNLKYQAALYPFSVSGGDYAMDFSTMSDWSQIVQWTTLENDAGELEPDGKAKVKFIIKVPETAPAGGQYAMIGIRSVSLEAPSTVNDTYEMASLIYAEVEGETKHEGEILENKITSFVTSGVPEVSTKLQNSGNVHETAEMKLTVKNVFGGGEISLSEDGKNEYSVIVMPDSTRDFTRELANMPALGVFEVTQDISFLGENSSVTSLVFICPIWFLALAIATVAAIIGVIVGGIIKRHKRPKIALEPKD